MKQQMLNFKVLYPKKAGFISLTTRHRYSTTDRWASCVVLIVLVIAIGALGQFAILGAVGWLNQEIENQFLRAPRVPVAERISRTLRTPVQAKQEVDEPSWIGTSRTRCRFRHDHQLRANPFAPTNRPVNSALTPQYL